MGKTQSGSLRVVCEGETPPRAWGRHIQERPVKACLGNTPTGVGKTIVCSELPDTIKKHPHGRGEDGMTVTIAAGYQETPPRAWGRRLPRLEAPQGMGNTPTGVGKTPAFLARRMLPKKHPHGRGEDTLFPFYFLVVTETPPRAWGRRFRSARLACRWRNTPTGVGKTCESCESDHGFWKHPHGRGEDRMAHPDFDGNRETPPRAWGRRSSPEGGEMSGRNTPTGVGKTSSGFYDGQWDQKHPHGRGEDFESPLDGGDDGGNTPTGVGKT